MSPAFTACAAALLLTAGAAAAGTLSSAILSSANAAFFECFVTNAGNQVLPITTLGVRDDRSNFLELNTLTCGTELLPGELCTFSAKVAALQPSPRRGFIKIGGISAVRGPCQLLTAEGDAIVMTDMR